MGENILYEKNYDVLAQIVAEKSVIRHVSKHRKPDGSFDLEGNKKIWNDAIARFRQIPLWAKGAPGFDDRDPLQTQPSMIFIPAQGVSEKRGTIVVAHGGGFESRTGCEGMHVAKYFADAGFNCAILTYRLAPYSRFDAINDMQRCIRLLRQNSAELGITQRVAVMGFSAGGMLSANCATLYDFGDADAKDPIDRQSCRPDAAVLGYGAFAVVAYPGGFFMNPFGDPEETLTGMGGVQITRHQRLLLAPEANITCDTPPFFIWQTNSDDPRNAFATGYALTMAGVPFEMHCFPEGVHGLALADGENDLAMNIPHIGHWAQLCAEWLEEQNI